MRHDKMKKPEELIMRTDVCKNVWKKLKKKK